MRIYSLAFFDLGQPQHQLGCLFVFLPEGEPARVLLHFRDENRTKLR